MPGRLGQILASLFGRADPARRDDEPSPQPETHPTPVKLVVGLGNPGSQYAATRHNVGFEVVDRLAAQLGACAPGDVDRVARNNFEALLLEATVPGSGKVLLVKPMTYMNLSGHSVREVANWYKVARDDALIVLDELDLPFGTLRMRAEGSAGGHNGLKSVTEQLGGRDVPRLRIGIGRGPGVATAQVLSRFSPDEERALPDIVGAAADCCERWTTEGIIAAMNRCNTSSNTGKREPEPAASA